MQTHIDNNIINVSFPSNRDLTVALALFIKLIAARRHTHGGTAIDIISVGENETGFRRVHPKRTTTCEIGTREKQ